MLIFDLAKVNDAATYQEPHQLAEGMTDIIVNGVACAKRAVHAALPGAWSCPSDAGDVPQADSADPWLAARSPQEISSGGRRQLSVDSRSGDQPDTALVCQVGGRPLQHHRDPVPEPDQEEDVQEQPEQPSEIAREPQEAEIRDRGVAADGGEVARIDVAEGRGRLTAQPQQRRSSRRACRVAWPLARRRAAACPSDG